MRKIDFEAHFYTPEMLDYFSKRSDYPKYDPESKTLFRTKDFALKHPYRLTHLQESPAERVKMMDDHNIEMQILSLSTSIDYLDPDEAVYWARQTNDYIYNAMREFPGRFQGYAAVPFRAGVDECIKELERCMGELGFIGLSVDSNFGEQGGYIDEKQYFPILKKVEEHNGILYIHPSSPVIDRLKGLGPQLAAAPFGFGIDVSIDIMRLICNGTFDKLPGLKVFIGHMGEMFPFTLTRMNDKIKGLKILEPAENKELPEYYFKNNIFVTTSGSFCHSALKCTVEILGLDHIFFGTDCPYEMPEEIDEFYRNVKMSDAELAEIYYNNARKLFGDRLSADWSHCE